MLLEFLCSNLEILHDIGTHDREKHLALSTHLRDNLFELTPITPRKTPNQELPSMSSSISWTAWRGPLPGWKPLSDVFEGQFPKRHTCGSILFILFNSSSESDQLKISMFLRILSGFRLHGKTLVPRCRPHRKMTCWNHKKNDDMITDALQIASINKKQEQDWNIMYQ